MSDLLKDIPSKIDHLGETEYLLSDIQKHTSVGTVLSKTLVVVYTWHDNWLKWCFLEWSGGDTSGNDSFKPFMYGEGPSGALRECRHSYIGDDGYVFYLNKKNFIAALDWLSQHYDMN